MLGVMASMSYSDITFVFHSFSKVPWGGAKMVFMYANHLAELGVKVTICFDCSTTAKRKIPFEPLRRAMCAASVAIEPKWYPLDSRISKKCIFGINDRQVPDSGHVVATAAETAFGVASLCPAKGKKHYFIQGFETWGLSEETERETFRLGMSNIVVSDWLSRIVEKESGSKPTLIKNPIDDSVFYQVPDVRRANEIAVLYHEGEHKGFPVLWEALQIVHEAFPDVVVNAFGSPARPAWFPGWVNYAQSATQDELRVIYSKSLIYACATVNEGFGLTLAESMFCGCALCSTDFLGVHEYANPDCALLSPINDPIALADNILELLNNPDKAAAMGNAGRGYASSQCSMDRALHTLAVEFGLGD